MVIAKEVAKETQIWLFKGQLPLEGLIQTVWLSLHGFRGKPLKNSSCPFSLTS